MPLKYVVTVVIWVAQSYTLYTEYISTILKGGSGKNGSTIAVSWKKRRAIMWLKQTNGGWKLAWLKGILEILTGKALEQFPGVVLIPMWIKL